MKRPAWSMMGVAILSCIGLTSSRGIADGDEGQSVTVAFGRGLNTAQQHNIVNHVILPNDIRVDQNGVVHFLVAGFHEPVIFVPGVGLKDIQKIANDGTGTFIFDPKSPPPDGTFYFGINPAGGNPPTQATPANPIVAGSDTRSNAQNRVESVGFPANVGTGTPPSPIAKPGIYLVICNVREHFQQGMFGFVEVKAEDD